MMTINDTEQERMRFIYSTRLGETATWRVMSLTDAKHHHIQKAAELNALQCAEMNEGREDIPF
tara:strand:- start:752 stop:940 length:189 start_codon:yes stop_codon:yes gene_type:complete